MGPNFSRANQEKKTKKQKTKVLISNVNENDIINIINDNSFNQHKSPLNNDNRYLKDTLNSKPIGVDRLLLLVNYREF